MKRWLSLGLLLIIAAPFVAAQEGRPWVESFVLRPLGYLPTTVPGVANQESRALVIGDGHTALGMYVFDPQGHCVGYDDEPSGVYDDRIVSWTPAAAGAYDVQIRNFGPIDNRAEASAK